MVITYNIILEYRNKLSYFHLAIKLKIYYLHCKVTTNKYKLGIKNNYSKTIGKVQIMI